MDWLFNYKYNCNIKKIKSRIIFKIMKAERHQDIQIKADGTFVPAILPFATQTLGGINIGDLIDEYYLTTESSLTSSCAISTSVTPFVGLKFTCKYVGTIATTTVGSTITFFGVTLKQLQLNGNYDLIATYGVSGASW